MLDGITYEIDLNLGRCDHIRQALKPYIAAARVTRQPPGDAAPQAQQQGRARMGQCQRLQDPHPRTGASDGRDCLRGALEDCRGDWPVKQVMVG